MKYTQLSSIKSKKIINFKSIGIAFMFAIISVGAAGYIYGLRTLAPEQTSASEIYDCNTQITEDYNNNDLDPVIWKSQGGFFLKDGALVRSKFAEGNSQIILSNSYSGDFSVGIDIVEYSYEKSGEVYLSLQFESNNGLILFGLNNGMLVIQDLSGNQQELDENPQIIRQISGLRAERKGGKLYLYSSSSEIEQSAGEIQIPSGNVEIGLQANASEKDREYNLTLDNFNLKCN